MTAFIPVIVAVISAAAILLGYAYQKRKQREFEIHKTRQEIYTRLIKNLTTKLDLFERVRKDPEMPERVTFDNLDGAMQIIEHRYPELDQAFKESREIMALMALYATDDALKASVEFYRQSYASLNGDSNLGADKGQFIQAMRRSLFPNTTVTSEEINLLMAK